MEKQRIKTKVLPHKYVFFVFILIIQIIILKNQIYFCCKYVIKKLTIATSFG